MAFPSQIGLAFPGFPGPGPFIILDSDLPYNLTRETFNNLQSSLQPMLGVPSAPSPKRAKHDWEVPHNEETWKCDEEAENVKTNDQGMALFERLNV